MKTLSSNTFTVLYETEESKVICSLKLTQRFGNDPAVRIETPDFAVNSNFVKINTLSTTHSFLIHKVQNGGYVDYINSIALCILKSSIPAPIVVGANIDKCIMLFAPLTNTVEYFYSEDISTITLEKLKDRCIETYKHIVDINERNI